MRTRSAGKGAADRFENGAAGEHEIGAAGADAAVGGALVIGHAAQGRDGAADVLARHPEPVDAAAVVARKTEKDAGDRRHRAGGAEQMEDARSGRSAPTLTTNSFKLAGDMLDHGLEDGVGNFKAAEFLRQGDDAELQRHPEADALAQRGVGGEAAVRGSAPAARRVAEPDDFRRAAADIE